MSSWLWGASQFDEEVDKATSELLPTDQEDIVLNLEICDQIKAKQVQPKDAMRALKRRLNHKNPNVQLLALTLTDICVKNGGNHFLAEISSREFMDNLVSILKIPALNHDVRNRLLKFIQNWAMAFEGKPEFSYVTTVYKTLLSEGYKFPPKDLAIANNAMTDTQIAPEWIDSDVCLRCRDAFTFTNRKHHCRNCGKIYDAKCSSKQLPLPHFGIMQPVRVCDACHFQLTRKKEAAAKEAEDAKKKASRDRAQHANIDYDLARAIELSLKESQGSSNNRAGYAPLNDSKKWISSEPPLIDRSAGRVEEDDEELRAAIEASLREAHAPQPSAPVSEPEPSSNRYYESPVATVPSYDLAPQESDTIMTFNQTVVDAQTYGLRDLRGTHELYRQATAYKPKLTRSLDDTERKEQMLSEMHDKLSQAVKLYDHLLTEQFAQSSKRQQAPSQPYYASYQQPQQPQWTPQPVAPYGAYTATPSTSAAPPSQQWSPATYQTAAPSTPSYNQERSVVTPPSMQQPVSYLPQQPTGYASPLPPVTLPPVSITSPYQPMPTATAPDMVAQQPAAYPAQPSPPVQTHPSLSRHNTIQSYQPHQANLKRANTVASQQPVQQPYAPQQYMHQQQKVAVAPPPTAPPVNLPVMPTAPTNAPSAYSLFGAVPNAPTAPPVAEPKEAMLIEF